MPRALKPDSTFSQDLSAGALSFVTSFGRRFKVENIIIKASVNITETITITLDSVNGSGYDTILESRDLVGEADFVWRPQGELRLQEGDEIKVQCTNANTTGTVRGSVKTSEVLKGA